MNSLSRHVTNRALSLNFISTKLQSSLAGASNPAANIEVPLYKERKPTDVLRALERTINRDPTAPHYKYHDDPYLIPTSHTSKRSYALAKEAGRKAAMFIRQEHANLFEHRYMDPVIEAFLPKVKYTSKDQVSEEVLKNLIKDGNPSDALAVYKLLEEEAAVETKLELLELLCYYNNQPPWSDDLMEEKWFRNDFIQYVWRLCPDTEKLFAFLKDQGGKIASAAYSAMICGTVKYLNLERAEKLLEEAEASEIPLTIEAYNSMISLIPSLKESGHDRQSLVINILNKIKQVGLQPNIETLNSALKTTTKMKRDNVEEFCKSLFTEFKNIGIEPSLGSYFYALKIFYRKYSQPSNLLREILHLLKGRNIVAQDKNDILFFTFAMEVAANNLVDPVVGDQIHEILLTGDNYNLIGSNYLESIYYKHFFILQVQNQPIDVFMNNYYDVLVPNVYVPEPFVMDKILLTLEFNDPKVTRNYLARIWTHLVQFDQLERKNLVSLALKLMRVNCKPEEKSPMNQVFGEAAWTVWKYVSMQQERRIQSMNWEGPILGDIAILCLRAGEVDNAATVISYLLNKQDFVIGVTLFDQIEILLDGFIMKCFTPPIIDLVTYCAENDFLEVPGMVEKVQNNLSLTGWEQARLKSLVTSSKGYKSKKVQE